MIFIVLEFVFAALFCPAREVDSYQDNIDLPAPDEIEAVELLIAAPSLKSPASIAGHLYLLLRRRNDISGLSVVIGMVANSGADESAGINPFLYSLRGLFGHYRSMVQRERLVSVINRNTIIEDRNVLRLQLKLNRRQKEKLLAGIKEMERSLPDRRYYFLNRNCTSLLLSLLREVYGERSGLVDMELVDMPLQVAAKIFRAGLAEFVLPDYPSISQAALNGWREIKRLSALKEKLNLDHDEFRDYFRRQLSLYRKEFSRIDRGIFYRDLFNCFPGVNTVDRESNGKKEFLESGALLLSFFQAAGAVERFQEYRKKSNSGEKRELLDFSNPQLTLLLDLTLRLRARLLQADEDFQPDYHPEKSDKPGRPDREKRFRSPFLAGYSVLSLAPGIVSEKGSFHLEYSFLHQQLGDQSLFAANRNSRLELLKLSVNMYSGKSSFRRTTLLRYDKVLTRPGGGAESFIKPGFSVAFHLRESGLHPGIISHTDSLQTSMLLNLSARDDLRHYLQARVGLGLASIKLQQAGNFNSIGLLGGLEGKIQLDYGNRLELRAACQYKKYFARSGFSADNFEAEVEINCIPWRRAGVQFYSGWRMQNGIYRTLGNDNIEYNNRQLLIGLRFGLDSLFYFFSRG